MRVIADLHLHSKYSRACSRDLALAGIDEWCRRKGINLVGTSDFTHPAWLKEIKSNLEEAEPGFYKLKNTDSPTRFVLSSEISCIYSQGGKTRRLHLCLLSPSIAEVEKIIADFERRGFNLKSDGRPIVGASAKELAKIILGLNEKNLVIPAHAWTPWFAVFGSKSGFDSLSECFEELTPQIYAIETGLSSDPLMNWHLSALDDITLLSNSDAHSPANLGREANVFELTAEAFNYDELYRIIKEHDRKKFLYTIEFFPEEGKYHFDGHAACKYSAHPSESKKQKNICPVCHKELTLGVMHRVIDLADRNEKGIDEKKFVPFKSLIPLQEIIADYFAVGKGSKKVAAEYFNLIAKYSEFAILIDLPADELKKITLPEIAEKIIQVRDKQVKIEPGYDGIYGKISVRNHYRPPRQEVLL